VPTDGILRAPRGKLENERDWEQFLRRLNEQVAYDGTRAVINVLATFTGRTATDIETMLQHVSDAGRARDQRFLPTVTFGNVASVQSVEPLTSSAGATTADILIAAHTLHTDFANIAYNSGSVTGVALNTRYYVYTDDPNYVGGAVTYVASTSRPNVPANSGRYFVGTIETPSASANTANISAATSANPIAFTTSSAHGWTTGDTVQFSSLPGDFGTNLNGNQYVITVTGASTFTIVKDGTLYAAYTAGGSATRIVADTGNDFGGGGGGYIP
jgi:hypothetical protein